MMESRTREPIRVLYAHLWWLVKLRWLAGLSVIVGAVGNHFGLHWFSDNLTLLLLGVLILAYNGVLVWVLRRPLQRRPPVAVMIWAQILPDLVTLSAMTTLTGGAHSPLLGFFVFHVVLISLLQPPRLAYIGATGAISMLLAALPIADAWPQTRGAWLVLAGWSVALLMTAFLANRITVSMRRHRWSLQDRNRRVRQLLRRIGQQQQTLIQHEKTVAMGRMAAGVAHEIANPLASMDSLLQLMQRNPMRLTAASVATLRQQVERIKLTVQQMTEFAHPTDLYWQTMAVDKVVDQAIQMIRFDRRHRQVQLERRDDAACVARVQPHALQQALVNLLINAMDAMANVEQPRLIVSTQARDGQCQIEIADNGHGIQPEHLAQIFEPFFTTKPVGKGTGLGLAITSTLIRNQGGRIEVFSEVGRGTTMRVTLPLVAVSEPAAVPGVS